VGTSQFERLEALVEVVDTLRLSARAPVLAAVTAELSSMLDAGVTAFRPAFDRDGWRLELIESNGLDLEATLHPRLSDYLATTEDPWADYEPLVPCPGGEGCVIGPSRMAAIHAASPPIVRHVYRPLHLDRLSHMSAAVCDGSTVLAVVDVFRERPLDREDQTLLERLVPPLRRRLRTERMLSAIDDARDATPTRIAALRARWSLTERQAQVLTLLARGDQNKDIATKLRCAPRTVEVHVGAVLRKACADNRSRLVAKFWAEG
jgi:DNA-binding CsgD family transcriptional regulator